MAFWLEKKTIIQLNHDSEYAGHLGIDKTSDLVSRNFYWPKAEDEERYFRLCQSL